jgi:hypothetical protein
MSRSLTESILTSWSVNDIKKIGDKFTPTNLALIQLFHEIFQITVVRIYRK